MLVGDGEPAETVVEHLRQAFQKSPLVKVKVQTDERQACETVAKSLTERVPCELVRRVGRVLVLFREADGGPENGRGPADDGQLS